jgi:anti-anti-sigma factor
MSAYRHIELHCEGRVFVVRLLDPNPASEEDVAEVVTEWNSAADCADCQTLFVDCSRVQLLTSEMVCKLITLQRRLKQKQAKLVLCGLRPQARAVLGWTRLDQVFEIQENGQPQAAAFAIDRCEATVGAPSLPRANG